MFFKLHSASKLHAHNSEVSFTTTKQWKTST